MASSSKRVKLDDSSTVEGYIRNVSPMKTSKNDRKNFNAVLQEENSVTNIVGFRDIDNATLKQMEIEKTPVKIKNFERTPSYKQPGQFDIKFSRGTTLLPVKRLTFNCDKPKEQSMVTKMMTVNEAKEEAEGCKVTMTVRIMQQLDSVEQEFSDRKLQRTTFIIADQTGNMRLTLWGDPKQIIVNKTYTFENLTVRFFKEKMVSTNPNTSIKEAKDINIQNYRPVTEQKKRSTIIGVNFTEETHCCFCNFLVKNNKLVTSIKCGKCNVRQLNSAVNTITNCIITTEDKKTYKISNDALDVFFPKSVTTVDDREIYILQNSKVEFTLNFNNIITSMKCVKKDQ